MGLFDFLRKKRTAEDASPDSIGDESVSISISKMSVASDTGEDEPPAQKVDEEEESISNERITKGITVLGEYEVLSDAVKGGMGSVWKVHRSSWNVDLAMKRPKPRFFAEGSEKRKERFIRECESWIGLGLHPNIVTCYFIREIGGVPTIFSEWMDNGSLEDRIRDRTLYNGTSPILQERLMDIAIQSARGLLYAHEHGEGLIHQDVKPDNLLLTKEWDTKVADFGLAHARAGQTAEAVGYTLPYRSYEQRLGEEVTRSTDIYCWAVSILEMYRGGRPWKDGVEAGQNCDSYMENCAVPVPEPVRVLLRKCLAEKPGERPQSFRVIGDALMSAYRDICGREYPRPEPSAAADTAGTLNNRALSYLDIGKPREAEELWDKALLEVPGFRDARFNRALYMLRSGQKTDYEVLEGLDKVLAEPIRKECGGVYEAPDPETSVYYMEGEADAAAVYEDTLYAITFSTYRQKKPGGIKRLRLDPMKLLDTDPMDALIDRAGDNDIDPFYRFVEMAIPTNIIKTAVCPAKGLAAAIFRSTICLYSMTEREVIAEMTIGTENLWEPESFLFDPDGTRLLLSIGGYDHGKTLTVVLEVPSLEVITKNHCGFIGFLPGGKCLLRGKADAFADDSKDRDNMGNVEESDDCETLILMERDGMCREVFRFEGVPDERYEYTQSKTPFLCYKYRDREETFRLDENFKKIEMDSGILTDLGMVLNYDAEKEIIYALNLGGNGRIFAVDLNTNRVLCTFNLGEIPDSFCLPDETGKRYIFSKIAHQETIWFSVPFPKRDPGTQEAAWRLTRIVSQKELSEEEKLLRDLVRQFKDCEAADDHPGMLEIYRRCRGLEGFSSCPDAEEMEKALIPFTVKTKVEGLRAVGILSEIPAQTMTPGRNKMYGISGAEREKILKEADWKNHELHKNQNYQFHDIDPAGENILYSIVISSYSGRREGCGTYQYNVPTGRTMKLSDSYKVPSCGAYYLGDGSILLTDKRTVRLIDQVSGQTIRTYPVIPGEMTDSRRLGKLDQDGGFNLLPNLEDDRFLVMIPGEWRNYVCAVFTRDGRLQGWWETANTLPPVLYVLPGGRFVLEKTYWGFAIYDIHDGQMICKSADNMRFKGMSPDGRLIYLKQEERGRDESRDIVVYRVDYAVELKTDVSGEQAGSAESEREMYKALYELLAPQPTAEHEAEEDQLRPSRRNLGKQILREDGDGVVRVRAELWLDQTFPMIQNDPCIQDAIYEIDKELGENGRFMLYPYGAIPKIEIAVEAKDFETCRKHCRAFRAALMKSGHLRDESF